MSEQVTVFSCPGGCPPGQCDSDGGVSSVTCSKCGQSAMGRAMWEAP